ncbi:meiosis-specific nuclear structural protein 1-like [Lepeophtheirus salmonis]
MTDRELVEAKRRQLLRNNDPDLRELESKLQLAYINKARAAQIAEKELHRVTQRSKAQEELQKERETLERCLQKEEKYQIMKEFKDKTEYRKALTLQIMEKNELCRLEFQDFLDEKKLIDDIVLKIKKEDEKKRYERLIAKKVEKELIDAFVNTQKEREKRDQEFLDRQNQEIQRYLAERQEILNERERIQKEKRVIKNESVLKLAEQIFEKEKDLLEKEDILREVYEGRKRDEDKLAEHMEIENTIRRKLDLCKSNQIAMELRQKDIERQRLEEEEYRLRWIETMEQEAKVEQMNDQKRRMKRLQLRKEAECHMEERRIRRIKENEEEMLFLKTLMAEEEERNRIVNEERMNLLRENASKLLGFLPPGLLRESDLDDLPSEVRKSYFQQSSHCQKDPLRKLEEFYNINTD